MSMRSVSFFIFLLCSICSGLVLATGLIDAQSASKSQDSDALSKDKLESRIRARWSSIVSHKFDEAYTFESPAYKKIYTEKMYASQFNKGIEWALLGVDVQELVTHNVRDSNNNSKNATVFAERIKQHELVVASVLVEVETRPKLYKEQVSDDSIVSAKLQEKWLHYSGQWWHSSSLVK